MSPKNFENIAFQHPTALVYGQVTIEEGSSLWAYSVIRSEINEVRIGKYTNIQDFVMIHVGDKTPVVIGDYCSIAHRAVIHGASIGNNCLIGIGAIIMDGCQIGDNSIISAGAYLPAKTIIPKNSIVSGNPASITKERNNYVANRFNAMMYYTNAQHYAKGEYRAWSDPHVQQLARATLAKLSDELKRIT